MLRHWPELTLFLRTPGAPLDNNLCERAHKTENGARVGDLFMSLIYSCQLSGASAFEYLTALQEHIADVARDPSSWMPWNYRDMLAVTSPPPA